MTRLRLLRLLLLALLLPFLVLLAYQFRPKNTIHTPDVITLREDASIGVGEGIKWKKVVDDDHYYEGWAKDVRQLPGGRAELDSIQRLEVHRPGAPPLLIAAERAEVEGTEGNSFVRVLGGIQVREEEQGLLVSLREMEVDQIAGEARSIGAVELATEIYRGVAERVVYGLDGQPTRLEVLQLSAEDGSGVVAREGLLHDGTRDIELQGEVRIDRGDEFLQGQRARVQRNSDGRMRHVELHEEARGSVLTAGEGLLGFESRNADVDWDDLGEPERLHLDGDAVLTRGTDRLAAGTILLTRSADDPGVWTFEALGNVSAAGTTAGQQHSVRGDLLRGRFAGEQGLEIASITGSFSFAAPGTRAEAADAEIVPGRVPEIVMTSAHRRRARLARGRNRVVADRIATDRLGVRLLAEGNLEATLLSDDGSGRAATPGLFEAGEAVHFVASNLASEQSGDLLAFSGSVRGWQGERTLSAAQVFVERASGNLRAVGDVHTRVPREEGRAVSGADFVQVSAAILDYSGRAKVATYENDVRIQLEEGWIESARVEVQLDPSGSLLEIRTFEETRFEFRQEDGRQPVSGSGDRAVYRTAAGKVTLYGEKTPATIDRGDQGVTRGRVLTYSLEDGTLEVDSGDNDRVKIILPEQS